MPGTSGSKEPAADPEEVDAAVDAIAAQPADPETVRRADDADVFEATLVQEVRWLMGQECSWQMHNWQCIPNASEVMGGGPQTTQLAGSVHNTSISQSEDSPLWL